MKALRLGASRLAQGEEEIKMVNLNGISLASVFLVSPGENNGQSILEAEIKKMDGLKLRYYVKKGNYHKSIKIDWPQHFFDNYGSLRDSNFGEINQLSFGDDIGRIKI